MRFRWFVRHGETPEWPLPETMAATPWGAALRWAGRPSGLMRRIKMVLWLLYDGRIMMMRVERREDGERIRVVAHKIRLRRKKKRAA